MRDLVPPPLNLCRLRPPSLYACERLIPGPRMKTEFCVCHAIFPSLRRRLGQNLPIYLRNNLFWRHYSVCGGWSLKQCTRSKGTKLQVSPKPKLKGQGVKLFTSPAPPFAHPLPRAPIFCSPQVRFFLLARLLARPSRSVAIESLDWSTSMICVGFGEMGK